MTVDRHGVVQTQHGGAVARARYDMISHHGLQNSTRSLVRLPASQQWVGTETSE